jgi:hypothetical protein
MKDCGRRNTANHTARYEHDTNLKSQREFRSTKPKQTHTSTRLSLNLTIRKTSQSHRVCRIIHYQSFRSENSDLIGVSLDERAAETLGNLLLLLLRLLNLSSVGIQVPQPDEEHQATQSRADRVEEQLLAYRRRPRPRPHPAALLPSLPASLPPCPRRAHQPCQDMRTAAALELRLPNPKQWRTMRAPNPSVACSRSVVGGPRLWLPWPPRLPRPAPKEGRKAGRKKERPLYGCERGPPFT